LLELPVNGSQSFRVWFDQWLVNGV
jgi:hypothetical protein